MPKDGLTVEVEVAEARSLMAADKNGLSDPYAVVELVADAGGKALKGESFKTKTHKKTLDPKFGERFTLGAATEDAELAAASLRVRLWDYDSMLSSDALGEIVMPLSRLIPGGDLSERDTPLPHHTEMKQTFVRGAHGASRIRDRCESP